MFNLIVPDKEKVKYYRLLPSDLVLLALRVKEFM